MLGAIYCLRQEKVSKMAETRRIIHVEGGFPITGDVTVEGAKNSALKLMTATLMAPGVSILTNVPNNSDVHTMGKVLRGLGASIEVEDEHTLAIDTSNVNSWVTPYELVVKMRASTAVLGPLIARFGRAVVGMPGGCKIGARKVDMHLMGLSALGIDFEMGHGNIHAEASKGLRGCNVTLEFPSVGATENLVMAGALAKGKTVVDNAACEPEIVDLACMLNEMGAHISGAGTPVIEIEGVDELHPTTHKVVGDRIEAGTFVACAGLVGNPVRVHGFDPAHLGLVLKKFEAMGVSIKRIEDGLLVSRDAPLQATSIQTLPFPGFPTDMQAQTMVLLALAKGDSVVTENIFENRFMMAAELNRMGANIRIEGHHALVQGVQMLSGAPVEGPDLRAGAALVLAGLVAEGYTDVSGVEYINRGYEHFCEKLRALGAHIEEKVV